MIGLDRKRPESCGEVMELSMELDGRMPQLLTLARALACPTRLFLLQLIGEDGMHLGRAAEAAGIAPSTASWHLGQLVTAGLAVRCRTGRRCIYRWGPLRWSLVGTAPGPAT